MQIASDFDPEDWSKKSLRDLVVSTTPLLEDHERESVFIPKKAKTTVKVFKRSETEREEAKRIFDALSATPPGENTVLSSETESSTPSMVSPAASSTSSSSSVLSSTGLLSQQEKQPLQKPASLLAPLSSTNSSLDASTLQILSTSESEILASTPATSTNISPGASPTLPKSTVTESFVHFPVLLSPLPLTPPNSPFHPTALRKSNSSGKRRSLSMQKRPLLCAFVTLCQKELFHRQQDGKNIHTAPRGAITQATQARTACQFATLCWSHASTLISSMGR
jgi:hypothetical protein